MVEYASSRFRLVWRYAARLPNVAVSAANTDRIGTSNLTTSCHAATLKAEGVRLRTSRPASISTKRPSSATAAPFDATDRNPATSADAPSNTSGHQKWNGNAASLKP